MRRPIQILSALLAAALITVPPAHGAEAAPFPDVPADAWYAEPVSYMVRRGFMSGLADGTFAPDQFASRAMLVSILWRQAGSPASAGDPFTDVPSYAWYATPASWAGWNGVITGYGGGVFGGEDPLSREQLVTILWRIMDSPSVEPGPEFADEWTISGYAAMAVDWSQASGIVNGKDGNFFDPFSPTTRAELSAILQRFFQLIDPEPLQPEEPLPTGEDAQEPLPAEDDAQESAPSDSAVQETLPPAEPQASLPQDVDSAL